MISTFFIPIFSEYAKNVEKSSFYGFFNLRIFNFVIELLLMQTCVFLVIDLKICELKHRIYYVEIKRGNEMNKFIGVFGLLFFVLVFVLLGEDYRNYKTEIKIPQQNEISDEETEKEDFFIAKTDLEVVNEELQKYLPSQVEIEDMKVKMTADKVEGKYISGKAESVTAFRYGTFSFKLNTISGNGLFPAIWLLPSNIMDEYLEVDIYELIGNHPDEFYGVLHYNTAEEEFKDFFTYEFDIIPESYVLTFEWTQENMTWYLNDEKIYTMRENVPDVPMYLIFNLAIGGNWPGDPDQSTVFPTSFDVEVLEFNPQETYSR